MFPGPGIAVHSRTHVVPQGASSMENEKDTVPIWILNRRVKMLEHPITRRDLELHADIALLPGSCTVVRAARTQDG